MIFDSLYRTVAPVMQAALGGGSTMQIGDTSWHVIPGEVRVDEEPGELDEFERPEKNERVQVGVLLHSPDETFPIGTAVTYLGEKGWSVERVIGNDRTLATIELKRSHVMRLGRGRLRR